MEEKIDENQILEFWEKNKIYEKSVRKNAKGKKFYMMDGPPYATGHIHMGTALNKILKDIAMRSHRLQGYDVFDRPGYDTHGVPIEIKIEKQLGFQNKQDIEKFGVGKFIDECKKFATQFINVMNQEFINLGVWMNFSNPYLTLDSKYIEAIWDAFKQADKKNLLYLGQYPVHICPRCETAVAFNEIEYEKQADVSIFVKFPLKNRKNTFLIIWTTTPWTLPANTGVMVHPDFIYQEIELSSGEHWIIAKPLVPKLMSMLETAYTEVTKFKGKEMENWEYKNPLSKNLNLTLKNAYRVVLSPRYVNLEEGTGLVHCAPGHGKEDYEVGKEANLEAPCPVDISGVLTKEAGKYAGKKARIVDKEIIEDLEKSENLVYKLSYSHDYPLCWRCKSPLLMISQPQWFLKISQLQESLLKENEKTNWIPGWMKLRMKAWLLGITDWPVSRNRYWGAPLPIWICKKCNKKIVIGSIKELEKLSKQKLKDVHKPEIDKIQIPCKCSGKMSRISEVLDVWFDSGVSSWAALDKKQFEKFWPADLNIEGKDQVRGWWNSQFILSQIKFSKKPFVSILEHGMILDLGKKKMSKSLGNIITPAEIIKKYSCDFLRYYFAKTSKGDDFAFKEEDFKDIQKVFITLINVNNFIRQLEKSKSKIKIEDRWILSRLNTAVKNTEGLYNEYKYPEVIQEIENFLVNDVSKTYIKIIRERSDEVYDTLNTICLAILKLLAPIIPFITEKIWQELRKNKIVKEESIHLSDWPKPDVKLIDDKLENEMQNIFQIIEKGLAVRDSVQIGLKWPLQNAIVSTPFTINKEFQEIIKSQINIKEIIAKKSNEIVVKLDTNLTPALESEGYARELSRFIQSERKKAGLIKEDLINLSISGNANIIEHQKEFIRQRVNARGILLEIKNYRHHAEIKIRDKTFKISFDKFSK